MKNVLCFGELLMRMSPMLQKQWLNEAQMPVYIGGAELNVANALARWGLPVSYSTALPDNYLSREIDSWLQQKNIDTSPVVYSPGRIGMYFLPQGADLKHDSVIYDRAASSFANLQPGMIDWENVFHNTGWFHITAIVPAISRALADVCIEALQCASRKKIIVSIDLNYRKKLWQYGWKPEAVMPALVEHCDVVMSNIWSTDTLLGIGVDEHIHDKRSKDAYTGHAYASSEAVRARFPKCKAVANTFRFDEGDGIRYYATFSDGAQQCVSREFRSRRIADKAGSGDCFMAGVIYGMQQHWPAQDTVDFAAAAAFGKLHERGDLTQQSVDAIKNTLRTHE